MGTTIKYLRRTTSGAAGNDLSTAIKYLRHTTSGAAGNGLSRNRGLLMCPFTTSAPHSLFFVRASVTNKKNCTAEVRGLFAQCVWGPGLLAVFIWEFPPWDTPDPPRKNSPFQEQEVWALKHSLLGSFDTSLVSSRAPNT